MSIEAMKQALEALERSVATCFDQYAHNDVMSRPEHFVNQAITVLRAAIEQAQKQDWYPHEEMQEEIARLSEIISTNAFYQAGHSDALEWAAQMAVLEDPRTSDWVYDDPYDLAKALRKGPEMPPMTQKQELVGWYDPVTKDVCRVMKGLEVPIRFTKPLYTSPPQHQPLTDEQLFAAYETEQQGRWGDHVRGLRAVEEAARNIKGDA